MNVCPTPLPAYSGLIMRPALHRGRCRCEHINGIYSHTKYIYALHAYYGFAKSSPETSQERETLGISVKGFTFAPMAPFLRPFVRVRLWGGMKARLSSNLVENRIGLHHRHPSVQLASATQAVPATQLLAWHCAVMCLELSPDTVIPAHATQLASQHSMSQIVMAP